MYPNLPHDLAGRAPVRIDALCGGDAESVPCVRRSQWSSGSSQGSSVIQMDRIAHLFTKVEALV